MDKERQKDALLEYVKSQQLKQQQQQQQLQLQQQQQQIHKIRQHQPSCTNVLVSPPNPIHSDSEYLNCSTSLLGIEFF